MKLRAAYWMLLLAVTVASPGCVGFGLPKMANNHRLPPAQRLMEPGPGVGGPGPGVLTPPPPGAAHASLSTGAPTGPSVGGLGVPAPPTVQITFNKPESMQVRWDVGGVGNFDSDPLVVPGRQNFPEGAIYRLKVGSIPGREGVELYPTLEIARTTPRTAAYLAHNAIPVQFSLEDWDQVLAGNFVTKVVYLPDPEFQKLAVAGVEMLVSTRLDPGVDPIVEADQRGSIMAIIRIGNKDIELPGTNGGAVVPAAYGAAGGPAMPMGAPPTLPSQHMVSGYNVPQYGMTMSGTPIGLPGPPHIPLGHGVSLQKHVIRNHTMHHFPKPPKKFVIHARQSPGYSYPKSPSRMFIREQSIHPSLPYGPPRQRRTELVR